MEYTYPIMTKYFFECVWQALNIFRLPCFSAEQKIRFWVPPPPPATHLQPDLHGLQIIEDK